MTTLSPRTVPPGEDCGVRGSQHFLRGALCVTSQSLYPLPPMEEILWRTMCRTDGIRLESQLCSTLHEHCLCCNTTLCGFLQFLNYLGYCCPKCPSTGTKLFQKHTSYACLNAPCMAKQVVPSRPPCESSNLLVSSRKAP